MKNQEIAKIFREIAKILELKGDNPFRIRAYERAAQNVESIGPDLDVFIKEDKLATLAGIGEDLADKIKEIVEKGTLKQYEELKKEIPQGLLEMLEVPGMGPKTVKLFYEKLAIDSIEKLEKFAKEGKLRSVIGVKEKTEENILRGIELLRKGGERTPFPFADQLAQRFIEEIKGASGVKKIDAAGSLRRKRDTVRDIDILVIAKNPSSVMDKFAGSPLVERILAKGETKSSVISKERNIQVDVRVVPAKSFGSALMYFTGSKEFNIALRQLAIKQGYKLNEYGIFSAHKKDKEKWLGGKTEEEIFSLMKMSFVPPELREDRGEVAYALEGKLPRLLEIKDIKGDFHVHSHYSDGSAKIEDIAKKAVSLGYEYIAVTDHSQSLKVAHGLDEKAILEKRKEIDKVNAKISGIRVLCGTEVDIDSNGNLDYPDKILKEFDVVLAAIHTGFKQSKTQLTRRIISACKNPHTNIIVHPTGKLWGVREPYDIDFEEIFKAAKDYNVALEINCFPQRLDLNDVNAMKAKDIGAKLALGTDSHIIDQLEGMSLGVNVARRAWLEKRDVLNSLKLSELLKWLKK